MQLQDSLKNLIKNCYLLIKQHHEYKKAFHRFRIVEVKENPQTNQTKICVKIEGMKNQLPIQFTPEELITHDSLLSEFSQTDVRAITFCALHNSLNINNLKNCAFKIMAQETHAQKTIYMIEQKGIPGEIRLSAQDLFCSDMLRSFGFEDIRNIIYTAICEQLSQEMECFNHAEYDRDIKE